MEKKHTVKDSGHTLSPYTGMSRRHWIEAGKYLLDRAFNHVKRFEDLLIFPTIPNSKTYPQPGDPPWRYRSLELEGLWMSCISLAYMVIKKMQKILYAPVKFTRIWNPNWNYIRFNNININPN